MQSIKGKLFAIVPVIGAALLGMVLSNLTMSDTATSVAQSPFDEVKMVSPPSVAERLDAVAEVSRGAGYQPEPEASTSCNCDDCLDEEDVRKIVRDEFNNQVLAEKQAPRSSIPNVVAPSTTYASPVVTYSVPRVTYSEPVVTTQQATTVRKGLFGRTIYRSTNSSGTCRIVNGQMICNQ